MRVLQCSMCAAQHSTRVTVAKYMCRRIVFVLQDALCSAACMYCSIPALNLSFLGRPAEGALADVFLTIGQ